MQSIALGRQALKPAFRLYAVFVQSKVLIGVILSKLATRRVTLIAAAAAATLLMGGCQFSCGTGHTVSSDELNKQVQASYENQSGLELTSIDCQEVDAEVGKPITCEATNENDFNLNITGTVTEYNSDTDKIKFDWNVDSAMAPGKNFATAAQQALAGQGATLTNVECPDHVLFEKGSEFTCTAEDANGDSREITVTLTDKQGHFNANLKPLAN